MEEMKRALTTIALAIVCYVASVIAWIVGDYLQLENIRAGKRETHKRHKPKEQGWDFPIY